MVDEPPPILEFACALAVEKKLGGQILGIDAHYIMAMWQHEDGHTLVVLEGGYIVAITDTMQEFIGRLRKLPEHCRPGQIRVTPEHEHPPHSHDEEPGK